MAKRIILISSFPLLVAIAIIAIVLAGIGRGQLAATPADIEQAKSQIVSLINEGKLADANAGVDKIMALPTNRDKGAALQQIAWTYRNAGQADKAITISDYVLKNWPKESFAVWAAMSMAISQIDKGNTADAEATTSRMIADYADNTDLAGALCVIADTYSWGRMYDRAGRLYRLVIDKSADSSSVVKSHLGLARVEILGLIGEKKFSLAQEKLDLMIVDFNDEPNLPTALFQAGQEFFWQRRYSESKDAFDHIKNLPDNSFTQQAKLWSAKANVCSLIGKVKDEQVVAAIDKLISDFNGDPGLAEAVQWVGKESEWTNGELRGNTTRYDTPGSIYQRLQKFADSTKQAEWDQKRLTHRMEIFKLIQEPNQAATDAAIETMVVEFAGRPELAGELRWVAWGYEEQPDKGPQAKQIYERIILEYPTTPEANEAVLDIRRLEIWDTLDSGEANSADALLDEFIADFKDDSRLPQALSQIAEKYYGLASRNEEEGRDKQAKEYYRKAIAVWEKIATQLPASAAYTPRACHTVAYCCFEKTGEYEKAIEFCQRVVINWPAYEGAGHAQFLLGDYYERLTQAGLIAESEANPIIEEAYQAVVEKYPNCDKVKYASLKLAELNFKKGQWAKATASYELFLTKFPEIQRPVSILYSLGQAYDNMGKVNEAVRVYNEFLIKAQTGDPRIENVRRRIEQLTGSVKSKSILSDTVLSTIYGGCASKRFCAGPSSCPGVCIAPGNGGVCDYPVCNRVSFCDCGASCKWCFDEPPIAPCTNSSIPCTISGSCSATFCYPSAIDKVCKNATTTAFCLGARPWCN